jgi:hypothetical protein
MFSHFPTKYLHPFSIASIYLYVAGVDALEETGEEAGNEQVEWKTAKTRGRYRHFVGNCLRHGKTHGRIGFLCTSNSVQAFSACLHVRGDFDNPSCGM